MKVLTSSSMKIAEAVAVEKGGSYYGLMENAGSAAAQRIIKLLKGASGKKALIFCGKGNNGGDGLVIARKLLNEGADVAILFPLGLDEQKLSPLARLNLKELDSCDGGRLTLIPERVSDDRLKLLVQHADVIIDAVFGTGFSGSLPEEAARLNRAAAHSFGILCALDIPSGINCDTGEADPDSFPAEYTFTFAALKPGHILKRSASLCGRVERMDIGISRQDIDSLPEGITPLRRALAAAGLPKRSPDSHKGTYGRLLNIGGCDHMTGAVMLSTLSALAGGAGLVKVAAPDKITGIIAQRILPCIHAPLPTAESGSISSESIEKLAGEMKWATAALMGCGMSVSEDTLELTEKFIECCTVPMVLDADALNCLEGRTALLKKAKAPLILTPHMKEMSRLTGESVELCRDRRFDIAASFAREYGVTLVLKDSTTVIADPNGTLYMTASLKKISEDGIPYYEGNPSSGLAKGGSGDLLAGLIAGLLSEGADPLSAALTGVWIHGRAGDLCEDEMTAYCMQPTDVLRFYPPAFRELLALR